LSRDERGVVVKAMEELEKVVAVVWNCGVVVARC
jgi:hypothetical protein